MWKGRQGDGKRLGGVVTLAATLNWAMRGGQGCAGRGRGFHAGSRA